MGANEKAQEVESQRLGPSGVGISALRGSYSPKQIQDLIDEQTRQTHYRNNAILGTHAPETVNKGALPQTVTGTAAERAAREKTPPAAAPTAIGPNGHRITVVGGKWVDAATGAPVQ